MKDEASYQADKDEGEYGKGDGDANTITASLVNYISICKETFLQFISTWGMYTNRM